MFFLSRNGFTNLLPTLQNYITEFRHTKNVDIVENTFRRLFRFRIISYTSSSLLLLLHQHTSGLLFNQFAYPETKSLYVLLIFPIHPHAQPSSTTSAGLWRAVVLKRKYHEIREFFCTKLFILNEHFIESHRRQYTLC